MATKKTATRNTGTYIPGKDSSGPTVDPSTGQNYQPTPTVTSFKDKSNDEFDDLIKRIRTGGYDPATEQRYYEEQRKGIDDTLAQSSRSVAADYARRGLGSSGLSTGAMQDAAFKAAAQRSTARLKAIDQATGDKRQMLMDELSALGGKKGINLQQQQLNAQNDAQNQQAIQTIMGLAAMGVFLSDERLKENIERYDEEALPGVPFASWEWRNGDGVRRYGVIAQDVEAMRPDLVVEVGGYKAVDYSFLARS